MHHADLRLGPRPGRRRAPQPRAPDAGSGEAEQTPRPWSRNGICYAVRGGGERSSRWKDLEAEPAAVRAHAVIGAEDAEIRQRLSQEQGASEVKRVQRSDGLHGKRCLRAFGHLPRQLENRQPAPAWAKTSSTAVLLTSSRSFSATARLIARRVSTTVSREHTTLVASRRSR